MHSLYQSIQSIQHIDHKHHIIKGKEKEKGIIVR